MYTIYTYNTNILEIKSILEKVNRKMRVFMADSCSFYCFPKIVKKNQFNIYMDTNTVSLLLVNYYKNIKDAEAKYSI